MVLLGHINQHLKNNNLGLRQIIDWAMYVNSAMNKSTWKRFVIVAKRAGLLSLAVNVTKMCEKHLGLPNTIKWRDQRFDLSDELLNVIMTDGNFGRREITSTKNNSIKNSLTRINSRGIYNFFKSVGLEKCELCKEYHCLELLAFIYGFLWCSYKGIITLFRSQNVKKQFVDSRYRIELFKKIGIKTWHDKLK